MHLAAGPHDVKSRDEALALARAAAETDAEARAKAGATGELLVSVTETEMKCQSGQRSGCFCKPQSQLKPLRGKGRIELHCAKENYSILKNGGPAGLEPATTRL